MNSNHGFSFLISTDSEHQVEPELVSTVYTALQSLWSDGNATSAPVVEEGFCKSILYKEILNTR